MSHQPNQTTNQMTTTRTGLPHNICPAHGLPMNWRLDFQWGRIALMCRLCWFNNMFPASHYSEDARKVFERLTRHRKMG